MSQRSRIMKPRIQNEYNELSVIHSYTSVVIKNSGTFRSWEPNTKVKLTGYQPERAVASCCDQPWAQNRASESFEKRMGRKRSFSTCWNCWKAGTVSFKKVNRIKNIQKLKHEWTWEKHWRCHEISVIAKAYSDSFATQEIVKTLLRLTRLFRGSVQKCGRQTCSKGIQRYPKVSKVCVHWCAPWLGGTGQAWNTELLRISELYFWYLYVSFGLLYILKRLKNVYNVLNCPLMAVNFGGCIEFAHHFLAV